MLLFKTNLSSKIYPIILIAMLSLMVWGLSTTDVPAPIKGLDTPENEFSGERAYSDLSDLLKEGVPHPAGSNANKIIQSRIIEKMRARGFTVTIQADFACQQSWASCSNVENIIATKQGSEGASTVLLLSHYDSGPVSIGATDDGFGVAVGLEVARILQHRAALKNNLIILFTDAEEVGLDGAEAFAANHPLSETVDILVNVEARGTSGPSAMFETGSNNDQLLNIYRRAVERPFANSLTYEVYKRMPNDTDYTVFKKRDIPGLNFASTGSAARYHSVLDNMEYLDKNSLQHHGENALSMILELGNMDLTSLKEREGDATYFDVYTLFLLKWPSSFNMPLSIIGLITLLSFTVMYFRADIVNFRGLTWSLGAIIACGVAAIGFSALIAFPLGHWQDLHPIDHVNRWPGKITAIATLLIAVMLIGRAMKDRASATGILLVCWTLIAAASVALSVIVTGATYMALFPLGAFCIGLVADYFRNGKTILSIDFHYSAHAGLISAAYIGLYHFHLLDLVLNFDNSAAKASALLFAAFALLPISAAYYSKKPSYFKPQVAIIAVVVVVSGVIALQIPGFTKDKPYPLNIIYAEDANSKTAFVTLEPFFSSGINTSKFYEIMGITGDPIEYPLPTRGSKKRPQMSVPYAAIKPAKVDILFDIVTDGVREIEAEISTSNGGRTLYLEFSEGAPLTTLEIKGERPIGENIDSIRPVGISLSGAQNDTFRMKVTLANEENFTLSVYEIGQLPDTSEIASLIAKRPDYTNTAFNGDRSIVYQKMEF